MGTLRVTMLGCGSSAGVPRATGDWGVCDPSEPKNRRTRCGLLLQKWQGASGAAEEATVALIDTPPDLRLQLAAALPHHIDHVLISHDHADQVNGFDDLRAFVVKHRRQIPVSMDEATWANLRSRFGYAFESKGAYPAIVTHGPRLAPLAPLTVHGPGGPLAITPLDQDHGFMRSLGFRIGPVAYSNDLVDMPEASFAALGGLDLWIVDALREAPHPTHAHLGKALEWISRLKPRHAVLTNMHIDLDYAALKAKLPAGVEPGYDGWAADFPI